MFKITFPDKDLMWSFIDKFHLSNYTANNTTATIEFNGKLHDKTSLLDAAEMFDGIEDIY